MNSIATVFDQTVPFVSGYSMRSRYIAESLVNQGLSVRAISSPIFEYSNDRETISGVDYIRTPQTTSNARKVNPLLKRFTIVNSIARTLTSSWTPDTQLVHAHSSLLNGLAASRVARKFSVPFLYECRAFWEDAAVDQGRTREGSLRYRMTRRGETRVMKRADHVTVICEGLKGDLIERGLSEDRITVIPNGVDTERFSPMDVDQSLLLELGLDGKFVVGFIGTFFFFEGLQLLVQAAAQLRDDFPDVRFLIVGGGDEAENLKTMAVELGVDDIVIFTGRVDHAQVCRYYSIMDLLVYPRTSRRITELVTPLKPLEAMAMRKPVLGSDVGGIKELVSDNQTGFLFRAGDVDHMVERISWCARNREETARIAEQGRQHVLETRSWSRITEQYHRLYESLGVNLQTQS